MTPFENLRVLDLTHVLAGPYATYQLAILGAEVIRVEDPGGDMVRPTGGRVELRMQGLGTSFLAQNANKKSVALDLKTAEGRRAAFALARQADVIVENHRAGVMARAGLDYEKVAEVNPKVIYCSVTGFGQKGPGAGHGAYDNVIQAASGLMGLNGTSETRPVMIGVPLLDYATGYAAAFAISAALLQRERTGRGQRIDVSMLNVAMTLMSNIAARELDGDPFTPRNGNDGPNAAYGCYETAEGHLMIGAYSPKESARLFRFLGEDDEARIVEGLKVEELPQRKEAQRAILERILPSRPATDWVQALQEAGVPAARVNSVPEAIAMARASGQQVFAPLPRAPQFEDMTVEVPVAGFAFEHGGPKLRRAPALLGGDTENVLQQIESNGDPWA